MDIITETKEGGTMEQGAEMPLESEPKDGGNIWLRSSCAAPVQGVGGERGQEWLYDTFIR